MQQDIAHIAHAPPINRSALISEIITRTICSIIMGIFVWRAYYSYALAPNAGLLILLLSELFTFGLIVFARMPKQSNRSLLAWVLVLITFSYSLVIDLSETQTYYLVAPAISVALQFVGFVMQVSTKVWLGRSFGLLPENRGLVTNGPYRMVRHPIYFGYLLNHVGFLLSHFSFWNLLVLAVLYVCQILRMAEEEKVLQTSPDYQRYMQRTTYRLVPFLY